MASLLRSNHDITFIASANNALALIHYITYYATKGDVSQYQGIMGAAFVKNAYNQSQTIRDITTSYNTKTIAGLPDKFALRAFNRLAYDRGISGTLVASSLLGLLEHYTMPCDVKSFNIGLLRSCFHELALYGYNQTRDGNNFVVLRQQTDTPSSLLDHYSARATRLRNFCLYDYVRVINIISRKNRGPNDIEFADHHRNTISYV